jgi:ubiquinone/menaquinone biosynthesis C-methylase UbiE
MDARLQRRVQRYGWDLAAADYETLWQVQLAPAQHALLEGAALAPGERVLDVACGSGLVSRAAARAVGSSGHVLGVDLAEQMVAAARERAAMHPQAQFMRLDGEALDGVPDASFDAALCGLGLMYMPHPEHALREMARVLRPGGRVVLSVWGERARCGWAPVFPIVEAEVASEVCPLFFRLGQRDALARACADAGFESIGQRRIATALAYDSAQQACDAAFIGGPVALAWSRFDAATREHVRARYERAIEPWRHGDSGYRMPGEFVIVSAAAKQSVGGGKGGVSESGTALRGAR